jgi:hypothetical protein
MLVSKIWSTSNIWALHVHSNEMTNPEDLVSTPVRVRGIDAVKTGILGSGCGTICETMIMTYCRYIGLVNLLC